MNAIVLKNILKYVKIKFSWKEQRTRCPSPVKALNKLWYSPIITCPIIYERPNVKVEFK
jgi:hypothetical protein